MDRIDKNRLIVLMDGIVICTLMKMSDMNANNKMDKVNNMNDEVYYMDAFNDKSNFVKYFNFIHIINFIHNFKFYPCV